MPKGRDHGNNQSTDQGVDQPRDQPTGRKKNNRRFKKPAVSTGTLQTVVTNRSKKMLDEHHHSLLSKGLSFCQDYTPYQPSLPHVKRYLPVQPSS